MAKESNNKHLNKEAPDTDKKFGQMLSVLTPELINTVCYYAANKAISRASITYEDLTQEFMEAFAIAGEVNDTLTFKLSKTIHELFQQPMPVDWYCEQVIDIYNL